MNGGGDFVFFRMISTLIESERCARDKIRDRRIWYNHPGPGWVVTEHYLSLGPGSFTETS